MKRREERVTEGVQVHQEQATKGFLSRQVSLLHHYDDSVFIIIFTCQDHWISIKEMGEKG